MAPFKATAVPAHLKRGRGQPTLYKPEYCQAVEDKMAQGYSLTAFAGSIRVDPTTVYAWIERHEDFSLAVARARGARVEWLETHLLTSKKGAQTTAAIFALKNANPMEWRDIRTLQHEHNVSVKTLTLEQLEAIASGAHPGDSTILNATFTRVEAAPAPIATPSATPKQITQSNQCGPCDKQSQGDDRPSGGEGEKFPR